MMNSKNDSGGNGLSHNGNHHHLGSGHHHHHSHHHSHHHGSHHSNGNGSNGNSSINQSHYQQNNSGLLNQNSNNLNGLSNNMNGMNAKLFSSLQQTHSNLQSNSSSPVGQNLNLQQQIMMQSPTVNMNAIAAYGQQPALLSASMNNQYNSSSMNNNNNNNYDDSSYNTQTQSQKQISMIQWYEVEVKGLVKNISPKLWEWNHLRCLYLNDNNLMRLPPAVSNLVNLQCLDASNNKIRTLPAEIGDMNSLRELYLNNNQVRVLPFEFGKLFKLGQLGLKGNPLTQDMMAIFMEPNGTQKLLIHLLDQLTITCPPPPRRPWMILAEPSQGNTTIFTTMCYNVLCDKYATRQYYGYCPAWALTWEYRKKLILDDIKNFNADVITLQELETEQFYQFFLPELRQFDYDGIFSPKSRAKTMQEHDKKHVDGCAIFFKTSRFSIVKDYLIEFNQIAMATAEGSEDMLNRVMTKDNIGLAALLEVKSDDSTADLVPNSKSPNTTGKDNNTGNSGASNSSNSINSASAPNNKQLLLVCTAHIHWDPEYCDVKLVQTLMFTNEIKQIIEQANREFRPHKNPTNQPIDTSTSIPVVICADLNSLPDSGVIEYLRSGNILANHNDFKDLGYDSCLQKINQSDKPSELSHNLKLECAYDKDIMPHTNYTFDFKGMIDYIFFSRQVMRTVGILGPLDMDWIKSNRIVGFPHPHVPSDHLPLMVELELFSNQGTPNQQQQNHMSHFHSSSSANLRPNQLTQHHNSHHHSQPHHHNTQQHSSHNQQHHQNNSSNSGSSTIGQMIPINNNSNSNNNTNAPSNSSTNNNGNFNFNFLQHSNLKK